MRTLTTAHQRQLDLAVVDAGEVAETGIRAVLEALALDGRGPFEHMSVVECAATRYAVALHICHSGGGGRRESLESLGYNYLREWIAQQRDGVVRGEAGGDDRLAAALELQRRLAAIIEGEPPFDLFFRWKPLGEQAIAWNPDLDDGVRLNIRPFLADDIPGGKKRAGVLRSKPNVHWRKDCGKEPLRDESDFPWFWVDGRFTGDRVNDLHFSNAEKRAARDEAKR